MDTMEMDDTVYLDRNLMTEVDFHGRKPPSRCVTVCLGLLCAVLLAGNLGQIIFYRAIGHPASEDPTRANRSALRGSYDAPAAEKEPTQITPSDLTEEKDRRRQSLGSPTAQRDEVEAGPGGARSERDRWRASCDDARGSLEGCRGSPEGCRGSLEGCRGRHDNLTADYERLETRHGDLRREKDQLQTGFNALREEMQQLQTNYSTLTSGSDRLQTGIDKLSRKIEGMLCPTRWRKFDASCYFVSTAKKNWTESRRACVAEGADLVVVDGVGEREFINGLLDVGQNAWMGLTDGLKEGEWTWVDGTPVTTANWQTGQPNDFKNQDCGEFVRTSSAEVGKWNDDGCFAHQTWICEK